MAGIDEFRRVITRDKPGNRLFEILESELVFRKLSRLLCAVGTLPTNIVFALGEVSRIENENVAAPQLGTTTVRGTLTACFFLLLFFVFARGSYGLTEEKNR